MTTTQPSSVSQSQIEELSKKVQSLRARADFANGAYIAFLVLTVLSTMFLARWTGKANRAQDELTREKDRQLQRDLKEKDEQMEAERQQRLEIEKALAPRIITLKYFGGEKQSNFDALKPFAETPVIIRFVDTKDGEPERAAQNVAALVNASGWNLIKFEKVSLNLSGGIKIVIDNPKLLAGGTMLNAELQELKSFKAAKALSDFLTNINWEVEIMPSDIYCGLEEFEHIPKDGIRVIVGPKPEWQFIPKTPSEEAFAEEMKKFGVKVHP